MKQLFATFAICFSVIASALIFTHTPAPSKNVPILSTSDTQILQKLENVLSTLEANNQVLIDIIVIVEKVGEVNNG